MTTPAELRALADTIEENRIIPERAPHVALLRSAAESLELLQDIRLKQAFRIEELELKVHALALMEKALEQAKRDENEACAAIACHKKGRQQKHLSSARKRAKNADLLKAVGYQGEPLYEEVEAEAFVDMAASLEDAIRSRFPAPAQGEKDETK